MTGWTEFINEWLCYADIKSFKLINEIYGENIAGKKLLDEVDDLKLLLTAYKKGIIKEV